MGCRCSGPALLGCDELLPVHPWLGCFDCRLMCVTNCLGVRVVRLCCFCLWYWPEGWYVLLPRLLWRGGCGWRVGVELLRMLQC